MITAQAIQQRIQNAEDKKFKRVEKPRKNISLFRRTLNKGPLKFICVMKFLVYVTIYNMTVLYSPWIALSTLDVMIFFGLILSSMLTLFFFLSAMWNGPRFSKLNWQPRKKTNADFLKYCNICRGYKPPRCHHCQECRRCVLKMDHHCYLMNTCIGFRNHLFYILFVLFSLISLVIIVPTLFRSIMDGKTLLDKEGKKITDHLFWVVFTIVGFFMSAFVLFIQTKQFFRQIQIIIVNTTTIEKIELSAGVQRRKITSEPPFQFPYNKTIKENLNECLWWKNDGIEFSLREGSEMFDMSIEEMKQSEWRRLNGQKHIITGEYDGAQLPFGKHFMAAVTPPNWDLCERRLTVETGMIILVTDYRRHWLFGEVIEEGLERGLSPLETSGWVPRTLCELLIDHEWEKEKQALLGKQKRKPRTKKELKKEDAAMKAAALKAIEESEKEKLLSSKQKKKLKKEKRKLKEKMAKSHSKEQKLKAKLEKKRMKEQKKLDKIQAKKQNAAAKGKN